MTTAREAEESVNLPRGPLLYRWQTYASHVLVSSARFSGRWLVERGWSNSRGCRCAGPFRSTETLRALRLSNTVPNGCELGPWQSGIELFPSSVLPAHHSEWSLVELAWLPPTLTFYEARRYEPVNETCCAPPIHPPKLERAKASSVSLVELDQLVEERHTGKGLSFGGVLLREWNAHPKGSPVYTVGTSLDGEFLVIDLPRD